MRLLIIGDLNGQFGEASRIAIKKGVAVRQVQDIDAAMGSLRNGQGADLIIIDVKSDIKSLVDQLKSEHIFIPVVASGFNNSKEDAVRAIKAGAKEYLPLPPDEELIAAVLEAIAEDSAMVMGKSPAFNEIINLINKVAPSDASILITGESGTGKEVISRYIHKNSKRADKVFIGVNCAAIPDNLLESELFGHEKGAFTGAIARRIGKFEEANNGTLLLDEISEIDIKLQAKLLRAIQEREIERIGGGRPVKLNIRIIATSNRDLRKEVQEGRFREDLFFRLNIINLNLPALRDRSEDILLLAQSFVKKYSKANSIPEKPLSQDARKLIQSYNWPGNVRELENTMHRAVLLAGPEEITADAFMLHHNYNDKDRSSDSEARLQNNNAKLAGDLIGRTMESVEKELVIATLEHCLGNRTHAANILGISIRTLRNKLHNYSKEGVDIPQTMLVDD